MANKLYAGDTIGCSSEREAKAIATKLAKEGIETRIDYEEDEVILVVTKGDEEDGTC